MGQISDYLFLYYSWYLFFILIDCQKQMLEEVFYNDWDFCFFDFFFGNVDIFEQVQIYGEIGLVLGKLRLGVVKGFIFLYFLKFRMYRSF